MCSYGIYPIKAVATQVMVSREEILSIYLLSAQALCNKIDALIMAEQSKLPSGIHLTVELSRMYPQWHGSNGKYVAIGHLVDLSRLESFSGEDKTNSPDMDPFETPENRGVGCVYINSVDPAELDCLMASDQYGLIRVYHQDSL